MTISPPFVPHPELVVAAWLRGIPGVPAVAAELPSDQTSWPEGFVTFLGLGGIPTMYSAKRNPVFQIDCWAVNRTSGRAPWGKANQLAEIIRGHTEQPDGTNWGIRPVELPENYRNARVVEATAQTEPRRLFDDQGSLARFTFDLRLSYVVVDQ